MIKGSRVPLTPIVENLRQASEEAAALLPKTQPSEAIG